MSLQKVTSYFDTLRNNPSCVYDEEYFDKLRKDLPTEKYDDLSDDVFKTTLEKIGDGSLKSLSLSQVKEIKEQLAINSVDRIIRPAVWRKCFRFWLRKDTTPKALLLVVDVQNDFISGTLALKNCPLQEDGAEVVLPINNSRKHFSRVMFTKDWHPADHCSFASNAKKYPLHATSRRLDEDIPAIMSKVTYDVKGMAVEQVMWPDHCIQLSAGAEFHKDLQVNEDDGIVFKGTNCTIDSYSAFWDNGKQLQTDLFCRLIDQDVTVLFCCGLAYDFCVSFTAQDSASHGFTTYVIKDLCRCISQEGADETAEKFRLVNAKEITSAEIAHALKTENCL